MFPTDRSDNVTFRKHHQMFHYIFDSRRRYRRTALRQTFRTNFREPERMAVGCGEGGRRQPARSSQHRGVYSSSCTAFIMPLDEGRYVLRTENGSLLQRCFAIPSHLCYTKWSPIPSHLSYLPYCSSSLPFATEIRGRSYIAGTPPPSPLRCMPPFLSGKCPIIFFTRRLASSCACGTHARRFLSAANFTPSIERVLQDSCRNVFCTKRFSGEAALGLRN